MILGLIISCVLLICAVRLIPINKVERQVTSGKTYFNIIIMSLLAIVGFVVIYSLNHFFGILGFIISLAISIYLKYREYNQNAYYQTQKSDETDNKNGFKIFKWVVIIFIVILAIVSGFLKTLDNDGDKWNSLSDEEKEWYIDNFGDGQYDEIQDAISDYRGY